jgi:hypothetical protein
VRPVVGVSYSGSNQYARPGRYDSLQKYCFTRQTEAQASDNFEGHPRYSHGKVLHCQFGAEAGDTYAPGSLCLTQERPGIEVPCLLAPLQPGLWSILPFQIFGIDFTCEILHLAKHLHGRFGWYGLVWFNGMNCTHQGQ